MVNITAERIAYVFPGQGSQKVGMGQAWAERFRAARQTFAEADAVLGFELSRLCFEGPEEELKLTANTQPALLATSVAILRVLERAKLAPAVTAGHSLGEYSALVAAGALDFATALKLVRRRGQLMQEAVPEGGGAMAAILNLEAELVEELSLEAAQEVSANGREKVCAVANYNAPGQVVIAGHADAVERAETLARERGARKVVRLAVSAPFHCSLMAPVRQAMAELLEAASFEDPRCPVVTNVDAVPARTAAEARDALIRQIDSPVRWIESVEEMANSMGVERFLEVGAGKVLAGLNRRIARGTETISLAEPAKACETLAGHGLDLDDFADES